MLFKDKKRGSIDYSAYIMFLPAMIVLLLFILYPVIWSFIVGFKEVKIITLRGASLFEIPGKFIGFENYKTALGDSLFIKSILNTLYYAVIYVPLTAVSSLALAVLLNTKMKGANFFKSILFIPYIISIVSASIIFVSLFRSDIGMVNGVLEMIGVDGPKWLANSKLAMPVIAIMSSWKKIGYFMLIYLAGLQNIPRSLYEAASIDGANKWQQFKSVTWPLLSRITLVVSILLLIDTLKMFQEAYIMTGGGPDNSTITIPYMIYNEAFQYYRLGTASAMSYLLLLVTIVIVVFQRKVLKKYDY